MAVLHSLKAQLPGITVDTMVHIPHIGLSPTYGRSTNFLSSINAAYIAWKRWSRRV